MLKISAFYLEKQKVLCLKKYNLGRSLYIGQESSNRWGFDVPTFREDFDYTHEIMQMILLARSTSSCHGKNKASF